MSLCGIRKSFIIWLLLAGASFAQDNVPEDVEEINTSTTTAQDSASTSTASSDDAEGLGDPYEYAMEEIVVTPHWIKMPEPEPLPPLKIEPRFSWKVETYVMTHGNRFVKVSRPDGSFYCLEVREPNPLEFLDYGASYMVRC